MPIRVLAMSDSHRRHTRFDLPPADVFIHAGDFSNYGSGVEEFAVWYWRLPYKHKLIVLGNHEEKDAVATRPLEIWRKLFGPTLLHNQAAELTVSGEKLLVYGAPYGASDFERVPDGTSVLITHEPPFTILDRRIGSTEVAEAARARQPRLHLFGHVHATGGQTVEHGATLHVNAATRAVVIDLGDAATVNRVIRPRA